MNRLTISGDSLRGLVLGAIGGGILVAATMLFVASRAGLPARNSLVKEDETNGSLPLGLGVSAIPADPAEGEDAAIFAGWC